MEIHHNARNRKLYCVEHRQKKQLRNAYYKITPNLLFEHHCSSGKFIRLPNRFETFLPELECSGHLNLQCFDAVGWAAGRAFSL